MKKQTRKSREDVRDLPLKVKAEMALKEAVAEALAEHKRRGNRILFLDNIRVCSSMDTLFKKDLTIVSCKDTKFPNSIS